MRTLTAKLTLAFLVVALTGTLLVAIFVGLRTQREFDQFILNQYQSTVVDTLTDYYGEAGSWDGVQALAVRARLRRPGTTGSLPVTLTDPQGSVIFGGRHYRAGQKVPAQELRRGVPVDVEGETVGLVLFDWMMPGQPPPRGEAPEVDFIRRVNHAILFGALGAGVIALLLGFLLARTITRPVRELTEATQIIAQGVLGHQVPVRTHDEIGELAQSFNRMSADLAHANQARRRMTADVAHELRTPLSIILGYTEALADGKLQGTAEMYDAMHGEARLLNHLIDDLRTLSLADAGELTLNRRPCSPRSLLERIAAAYAAQAEQLGVELRIEAGADLPAVEVDPDRMAQVLGNLVSNALRYTPRGGNIVLGAAVDHEAVALRVQDTGAGIEAEDLPHIFHRFFRADAARPQNGETGLGLSIAKGIVEAHGGTIAVESALGQGTTFFVRLPT